MPRDSRHFSFIWKNRVKVFSRFLSFSFLITFLGFNAAAHPYPVGRGHNELIGERFNGEVLKYELGFWFFFPAGKGTVSFQDMGAGKYKVSHEGMACGFIGWLTGNRREIYKSLMTTINAGRRLIPLSFEEAIISHGKVNSKRIFYRYDQRRIIMEREKGGEKRVQEKEIPYGFLYDDPVTAFYNFRHGVYGRVDHGKEFILRTLPEQGEEIILIRVAAAEETRERRAKEKVKEKKDFLVRIFLPRELWGKKRVEIEVWFDKELIPVSGVVKALPFLGDIEGKCTYRGFDFHF